MLTIFIATVLYLMFGIWALIVGRAMVEDKTSRWMKNVVPIMAWLFWPLIMAAGVVVLGYIIANKDDGKTSTVHDSSAHS